MPRSTLLTGTDCVVGLSPCRFQQIFMSAVCTQLLRSKVSDTFGSARPVSLTTVGVGGRCDHRPKRNLHLS